MELISLAAKFGHLGQPGDSWHPLLYHMLDVAAVAESMWDQVLAPATRTWTANGLGLDEEPTRRWVALLAGAHDLGKASCVFQRQDRDAQSRLAGTPFARDCKGALPGAPRHGTITAKHLQDILNEQFGLQTDVARQLAVITGGHHGTFPRSSEFNSARGTRIGDPVSGETPWSEARQDLVRQIAGALRVPSGFELMKPSNALAMVLAGLISVADWIGSNTDFFAYTAREMEASEYLNYARRQARKALRGLRWLARPSDEGTAMFADLFPQIRTPYPLQTAVESLVPKLSPPTLLIIEAPMGEGKTEAAFFTAHHWRAAHGLTGAYVALPTMATSNQMFDRLKEFLRHRYPNDFVNTQLLHGHAVLSEALDRLPDLSVYQNIHTEDTVDGGKTGAVGAAEWFTHRKRGLLAPFGAGTIDQALLSVLQVRHGFVRLFGLTHKVVVIDEVHAYDAYMSTLLERLLEWLAALGSPVVLLSATLPTERRRRLMTAYADGLGRSEHAADATLTAPYPRISWVDSTGFPHDQSVEPAARSRRAVRLVRQELPPGDLTFDEVARGMAGALQDGGCLAVICNTVGRAQQMYLALKPHFPNLADDGEPELDLLHSRFLFKDRNQREQRALRRFGPPDKAKVRPYRAVLVATQIIEQSLDLDFDLMVTDFAPVDLLLQRSGRLKRHDRPTRPARFSGKDAELWVLWPPENEHGPQFDSGTTHVYDEHILLRTWHELRRRDAIAVPEDVQELIDAVYQEDLRCPDKALRERWEQTLGEMLQQRENEREEAKERWVHKPSAKRPLWEMMDHQLEEDQPEFHEKHQALTRLTSLSVSVVFLYLTPEGPKLSLDDAQVIGLDRAGPPDVETTKLLLHHSVAIAAPSSLVKAVLNEDVPRAWHASAFLRHHRCILLDSSHEAPVGNYIVRIDPSLGVTAIR